MDHLRKLVPVAVGASGVILAWLAYIVATRPEPVFPTKKVEEIIKNSSITKTKDTIVLITGSTGGIGMVLAEELYRIGVTVIIASRNEAKCKQTVEDIKEKYPDSKGALDYGVLDTGDLQSVKDFCSWYKSKYSHITVLMNNAGQHYAQGETPRLSLGQKLTCLSKQGYDEIFAINYLGHFLLTELLLPLIKNGRVINVASAYHFASDGSTLKPREGMLVDAANGVKRDFKHRRAAYAVTKLAQILHVRELARRSSNPQVKFLAVCPGWVRTGMIPHGPVGAFLNRFNFTPKCGILVLLATVFDEKVKSGDFSTNYSVPLLNNAFGRFILRLVTILNLRASFVDMFAAFLVMVEARSYGYQQQLSSAEAEDPKLAAGLYDWTIRELTERGYLTKK